MAQLSYFIAKFYIILMSIGVGVLLNGLISSSRYISTLNLNRDRILIAPIKDSRKNSRSNETQSKSEDDDFKRKRIAWLLSFPNSGTSFTTFLIRAVTQTNTGSNYGHESGIEKQLSPSLGIFADNPVPSWTESWNKNLQQPSKGYILTKTHCGGFSYCKHCDLQIYNSHTFLKKCLEGDYVTGNAAAEFQISKGFASKDMIGRAVHIIRDPFDNVVARFHLERKTLAQKNEAHYPNTREGFREFCNDRGRLRDVQNQANFVLADVLDLDIPCQADFYRYIQWHNMAFTISWDQEIPTLVIHYESYTTNLNKTKNALLEFLGQDEVADAPPFITGKTYRDYYTDEEIEAVSKMTERLALRETWQHTKHYFGHQHDI